MFHNWIYYTEEPILPEDFCNKTIDFFEERPEKEPGMVGSGLDYNTKRSTDLAYSMRSKFKEQYQEFVPYITTAVSQYVALLEQHYPPLYYSFERRAKIPVIQVQRTYPGEYFNWHHDDHEQNGYVRGYTFIFYLNTIKDKGYTEFYDGTTIQPKQGHCLIFPSTWNYLHRGVAPATETKYIATGWGYYKNNIVINSHDSNGRIHPDNHQ